MLGYRSYFTVPPTASAGLVTVALGQVRTWLRSKGYDADLLQTDAPAQIGDGVVARVTSVSEADRGESVRFTLREEGPTGTWSTELVVHAPPAGDDGAFVWLDIDAPTSGEGRTERPRWTAAPRLARELVTALDARDGIGPLTPRVLRVAARDVDVLMATLSSADRRGPVFVAGSDATLPMRAWSELVGTLLKQTTGLSSGYVLDAAATRDFNRRMGAKHAVPAGTMRTFLPGVEVDSDLDALRHRLLTTQRILEGDAHRLVRVLGTRARDTTLERPIPPAARAIRTSLLEALEAQAPTAAGAGASAHDTHDDSFDGKAPASESATEQKPPTGEARSEPSSARVPVTEPDDAAGVSVPIWLSRFLVTVFGTLTPARDVVASAARRLAEGANLAAELRRKQHQVTELSHGLEALRDELASTISRLEDEQLEHRDTFDSLAEHEQAVHSLRMRLQSADRADEAWKATEPHEEIAAAPDSFDELLARFDALQHVVFTGDPGHSEELDVRDPMGLWAAKSWNALLALEDYVRCRLDGTHHGNVAMYLAATPPGYVGYSAQRHARDESDDVKQNPKYRNPRMLPVPTSVDPAGEVFMGAHFKIAQSARVSPRLHYYDAFEVDQKIYVGYVGRHLPTQQTN